MMACNDRAPRQQVAISPRCYGPRPLPVPHETILTRGGGTPMMLKCLPLRLLETAQPMEHPEDHWNIRTGEYLKEFITETDLSDEIFCYPLW